MDVLSFIPTVGNLAYTIAAFIVALSIIVAVHEYGHYIVGKWSGIKADVFSIGFGPVIWSRIGQDGTKWQIAALPFGGYVKFHGDANAASAKDGAAMSGLSDKELRTTMHGAPLWARTLTVLAGPVFNFILSFLVFSALLFARGVASDPLTIDNLRGTAATSALANGDILLEIDGQKVPGPMEFQDFGESLEAQETLSYTVLRDGVETTVEGPWLYPPLAVTVTPGAAAEEAGLKVGDLVTAVNGTSVFDFDALRDLIRASQGAPVLLTVDRGGEMLELTLTPCRTRTAVSTPIS